MIEERTVDVTHLIPVKPFETYLLDLTWDEDDTGKRRAYLRARIGDLQELEKIGEK